MALHNKGFSSTLQSAVQGVFIFITITDVFEFEAVLFFVSVLASNF